MNQELLRKYARTLLQSGVNLQEKQTLIVSVDVDNKDFAVIVTEEAYQLGAKRLSSIGVIPQLHDNAYYMLMRRF